MVIFKVEIQKIFLVACIFICNEGHDTLPDKECLRSVYLHGLPTELLGLSFFLVKILS